jgi:hypothetical protein
VVCRPVRSRAKKLIAVAQHWLRGGSRADENRAQIERQLRQIGMDDAGVTAALDSLPPVDVCIWPWQADSVRLFFACSTQWRYLAVAGLGGGSVRRVGLDYPGVTAAAAMAGISVTEDVFDAIRIMEGTVLSEGNDG